MANLNLTDGNKWAADSIYDTALEKSQPDLNAAAAAVADLIDTDNNGKLLGIVDGSLAAVTLTAWTGGSF